jgi:hypothetical protein
VKSYSHNNLIENIEIELPGLLEHSELQLTPGLNFKLNDVKLAKFTVDYLDTLDLSLKMVNFLGIESIVEFDETISYNDLEKAKFKNFVMKKGGYLNEESNYIRIHDKRILSESMKASSLRNSRVILFWRGLDLDDVSVKKILSLGLAYLLENLSKAELIFEVRKLVPKGIYEISIDHKYKTYVIIGVESPIFSP